MKCDFLFSFMQRRLWMSSVTMSPRNEVSPAVKSSRARTIYSFSLFDFKGFWCCATQYY